MMDIDNLKRNKLEVDILVGGLLFLTVFISKINILSLPYHWDELGAYIMPTHWLAHGSLLRIIPGLHLPDMFFGFFAVLIKETSVAIIVPLLIYFYFTKENKQQIHVISLKYTTPLLALFIFFIIQRIATGMFLPNPYFNSHPFFGVTGRVSSGYYIIKTE